jgi:iron-sulfur cluster assembly protein
MAETSIQSNPTLISVSEAAVQEIARLLPSETGKSGLRLEIKGGGCSGMSYGLTFDNAKENDNIIETQGIKIFVDPKSAIYLKGTLLEFQGGLEGRGFVLKNPQAKGSCGCGQSFSV